MRRDAEPMGWPSDLMARLRLGRERGLRPLASAAIFEPVLKEVAEMAGARADDNVVLLGAVDLRPVAWLAPRCRQILVVDDLPDETLSRLETDHRGRGLANVKFQWGRANVIPAPQYTTDRLVAVNYLFRSREPRTVIRQMVFTSRHEAVLVCCEPSASLDARTARKYSREANLPMEDHRALVAYAGSAAAHRGFTREGLSALFGAEAVRQIEVRELLHGLVLAARGVVHL